MVTNKKYDRLLHKVIELEENYKKVLKREEEELKKFNLFCQEFSHRGRCGITKLETDSLITFLPTIARGAVGD